MKTIYHIETLAELLEGLAPVPSDPQSTYERTLPAITGQLVITREGTVELVNDKNYTFVMSLREFFQDLCRNHTSLYLTQWDNFPERSL